MSDSEKMKAVTEHHLSAVSILLPTLGEIADRFTQRARTLVRNGNPEEAEKWFKIGRNLQTKYEASVRMAK